MTSETPIIATTIYGSVKFDQWKLPPMMAIQGDVKEIKASYGRPTDKRERRWLAAVIILGQPFA